MLVGPEAVYTSDIYFKTFTFGNLVENTNTRFGERKKFPLLGRGQKACLVLGSSTDIFSDWSTQLICILDFYVTLQIQVQKTLKLKRFSEDEIFQLPDKRICIVYLFHYNLAERFSDNPFV